MRMYAWFWVVFEPLHGVEKWNRRVAPCIWPDRCYGEESVETHANRGAWQRAETGNRIVAHLTPFGCHFYRQAARYRMPAPKLSEPLSSRLPTGVLASWPLPGLPRGL